MRTAQLFQNVCQSRADYTRGIRLLETPFNVSQMPVQLRKYWITHEAWAAPGAFDACVKDLREHGVPGHEVDGACANLHHEATGQWPGHHKNAAAKYDPTQQRGEHGRWSKTGALKKALSGLLDPEGGQDAVSLPDRDGVDSGRYVDFSSHDSKGNINLELGSDDETPIALDFAPDELSHVANAMALSQMRHEAPPLDPADRQSVLLHSMLAGSSDAVTFEDGRYFDWSQDDSNGNIGFEFGDSTESSRIWISPDEFAQLHASLATSLIDDAPAPQNAVRSQFFAHLPGLHDQRDHGRKGKKHVPSVDVPNVDIPDVKPGKEKKATKTPSTRVARPRTQPARLSEAGIADAVGTGITGRQQLTGGGNAFTDIVRTQSGATLVWKKVIGSKHRLAKRQTDGETLGSKLAAAIGAPAPHVHQLSEDEVVMEFMAGTVAAKASKTAQQKAIGTEAGHRLGLLDLMTQAYDRSGGNWIIDGDGNPIGIDHAFAFDDLGSIRRDVHGDVKVPDPYEPVFEPNFIAWDGQGNPSWKPNAMSVSEMAQIRQRVTELQPEFEAAGRQKWFQDSLEILDTVAKYAAGSGAVS